MQGKKKRLQFEVTAGSDGIHFSGNTHGCHQGDGAQLQLADVLHEERCDAQRGHLRVGRKTQQACERGFFFKNGIKGEILSPKHKNLEDRGVGQQLDLQELRHAADDVADFAVEHDHHLLLVAGALRLLGL